MKSLSQHINESILLSIDESILSSSGAGKAKVNAEYEKYGLDPDKITFNSDGTIDYDGHVRIVYKKIYKFPFKFNEVNGSFYCDCCELTTLEGCPKIVQGDFTCQCNQLTSLEGGPEIVNGNLFTCSDNNLTNLKGGPKIVKGSYYCRNNRLHWFDKSFFDYMPEKVGKDFITNIMIGPNRDSSSICNKIKQKINKIVDVKGDIKVQKRK